MKNKYKYIDTILFDLDGTLVSPRRRLYSLFIELTGCDLTFEKYWELKEKGFNQRRMLEYIGYNEETVEKFNCRWLKNVERAELLKKDEIFPDVVETLNYLCLKKVKLYLVSNRQSLTRMKDEIACFGIRDLFSEYITTLQKCSKDEAVTNRKIDVSHAVFVGDSAEDMDAAEKLSIPGIFINRKGKDTEYQDVKANIYIGNLAELLEVLDFEK